MGTRNPIQDRVAIAGVGMSPYTRDAGGRSPRSLVAEAATQAIRDAGLTARDVDGLAGPNNGDVQQMLGIPAVTYYSSPGIPFVFTLAAAANAVFAGQCETVLAYHVAYRHPGWSRAAAQDPFRVRHFAGNTSFDNPPESIFGAVGYAAWASRYIHEHNARKETFGLVAINDRTNARMNPHAVMQDPLDMETYLAARMIREPLCMLDMDVPIDGADAFIVTTVERARTLPKKPVLIHAMTSGQTDHPEEDQQRSLYETGQNVVVRDLFARSALQMGDFDIFFPYDGFTIITLLWLENLGFCGRGEAGRFLEANWDKREGRIKIDGKMLVNTHGGSLSEGGTQGSGHVREAVVQLRGEAGARQAPGVKHALLTPGGFFFNSQGLILRTD